MRTFASTFWIASILLLQSVCNATQDTNGQAQRATYHYDSSKSRPLEQYPYYVPNLYPVHQIKQDQIGSLIAINKELKSQIERDQAELIRAKSEVEQVREQKEKQSKEFLRDWVSLNERFVRAEGVNREIMDSLSKSHGDAVAAMQERNGQRLDTIVDLKNQLRDAKQQIERVKSGTECESMMRQKNEEIQYLKVLHQDDQKEIDALRSEFSHLKSVAQDREFMYQQSMDDKRSKNQALMHTLDRKEGLISEMEMERGKMQQWIAELHDEIHALKKERKTVTFASQQVDASCQITPDGEEHKVRAKVRAQVLSDDQWKVRLCRFYQSGGYCKAGSDCTFAHGVEDIRRRPSPKKEEKKDEKEEEPECW